jgi:hypothetical protein
MFRPNEDGGLAEAAKIVYDAEGAAMDIFCVYQY